MSTAKNEVFVCPYCESNSCIIQNAQTSPLVASEGYVTLVTCFSCLKEIELQNFSQN